MQLRTVQVPGLRLSETRYAPGERMPVHAHAEACVTLVLSGSLEERAGQAAREAGAAAVGIKPVGLEHSDGFGPGGAHTLKLKLDASRVDGLEEWGRPLAAWHWVSAGEAAPALRQLLLRLRERAGDADAWLEDSAVELLGALQQDARLGPTSTPPPWLKRLRSRLEHVFTDPVPTSRLAAQAGVHPVYVARVFRQHYGESISACVRRLRVQAAARMVADTRTPLSDIAFRTGFSDQSHLTRTFRRETGSTPARWRRL